MPRESSPPAASTGRLSVGVWTGAEELGGAETSLANLLEALPDEVAVTVLAVHADIGRWVAAARPGTPVLPVPALASEADVAGMLALRSVLRHAGFDVLHANLSWPGAGRFLLLVAATLPGLPTVAVEQLAIPLGSRKAAALKRFTSARLAAHVSVGERAGQAIAADAGFDPASLRVIPNGVPESAPLPPRPPDGRFVLGGLARLTERKGFHRLIEAAAALREDAGGPSLEVLLIGDGDQRGRLEAQAAASGVPLRITGWVDQPRRYLAEVDVVVLPSAAEGLPLSLAEAMLDGRPVVATDVGSVRELVGEGTGLLVPPGDVGALTTALRRLRDDPALHLRLVAGGRDHAEGRFTATAMAGSYLQLWRSIRR